MKLRFSSYAPREQKLQFFIDASRDEENNKTKLEDALAARQKYFRGYFECPDDYNGAYKVSGCDMAVFLTATKNNFLAEYTNITQNDWEAFVTSINQALEKNDTNMLSGQSIFSTQTLVPRQIDKVCALAQKGYDPDLKAYLNEVNIDLTQKNSQGFTVFEFLSGNKKGGMGIALGNSDKKHMDHLLVIVTLLNHGAKPIPHADIYENYGFLAHGSIPWVAALFLMAGFNELPKNTNEYKNHIHELATMSSIDESVAHLDKMMRDYANLKNSAPASNLNASSSSSSSGELQQALEKNDTNMLSGPSIFSTQTLVPRQIDKVCALAQKGYDPDLKAYLNEVNVDLTQKNSQGFTVFEFLSGNKKGGMGIVLGNSDKKHMDHLLVIVTLLNHGAKPIPHADIYENYGFLAYGCSPWVAALFLMAGFNELPKHTNEYKNHIHKLATMSSLDESVAYLDKMVRDYANLKNSAPASNLNASSSSSSSSDKYMTSANVLENTHRKI